MTTDSTSADDATRRDGSRLSEGLGPNAPLLARLQDEADLCRNEGANDIAALLDEAAKALQEKDADAEMGAKWRCNSSLEAWFPITAEEVARLRAEAHKSERRAIAFGDIVHQQVLAMRAAVVAWQRQSPQEGMRWIANTLAGPGHLPSEPDIALGAQALFDKEMAEHEAFRAAHPGPVALGPNVPMSRTQQP